MAKFVKRQKRQSSGAHDDHFDDDESTMTQRTLERTKLVIKGAAKRAVSPFKSVFGRKKKPVMDVRVESALKPESTENTALLPTLQHDEDDEKEVDILEPEARTLEPEARTLEPEVETPAPKVDMEPSELIYQDDNDGKKESKGLCAPCEGCSIL